MVNNPAFQASRNGHVRLPCALLYRNQQVGAREVFSAGNYRAIEIVFRYNEAVARHLMLDRIVQYPLSRIHYPICFRNGGRIIETFDILDCRGRRTGEIIERGEAHRTGAWHGAFHCLVISERGGQGYALFQKRSLTKKIAPGKFDVSVGGHYTTGEDASVAGPREIREELGLDVR